MTGIVSFFPLKLLNDYFGNLFPRMKVSNAYLSKDSKSSKKQINKQILLLSAVLLDWSPGSMLIYREFQG